MAAEPMAQACEEILALLPQQPPFRFVDRLTRLDEQGAEGSYRFRGDEFFYRGHFPGDPITPGVILLEAMAQVAVVAHGIYLYRLENPGSDPARFRTLFTDCVAEFSAVVRPGDEVVIRSQVEIFRKRKMRSRAELSLPDGRVAVTATLSGLGVSRDAS